MPRVCATVRAMDAPPKPPDGSEFAQWVAPYRSELKAHCYRMSGSLHDAEDLLQEALLRAWRGLPSFEGRASPRTWLYRITTNACLNALEARKGRGLPIDHGPAGTVAEALTATPEGEWLEPCPAPLYSDLAQTPEARYGRRESVALAFLAALQLLPARQRAALILHEVLGWSAEECAGVLEMTPTAVHSAVQRARATLSTRGQAWRQEPPAKDLPALLERYLEAWEASDLTGLVALLREDATLSMPPIPIWLRGAPALEASMRQMVFSGAKPGDFRAFLTEANGVPALALYKHHQPYALHVVEPREGRIQAITAFLDPRLFPALGLPAAFGTVRGTEER